MFAFFALNILNPILYDILGKYLLNFQVYIFLINQFCLYILLLKYKYIQHYVSLCY